MSIHRLHQPAGAHARNHLDRLRGDLADGSITGFAAVTFDSHGKMRIHLQGHTPNNVYPLIAALSAAEHYLLEHYVTPKLFPPEEK